jgi:histidinol-phosphate/aromatic aminotransferase/cobyric acid decarboxylase-like protein
MHADTFYNHTRAVRAHTCAALPVPVVCILRHMGAKLDHLLAASHELYVDRPTNPTGSKVNTRLPNKLSLGTDSRSIH